MDFTNGWEWLGPEPEHWPEGTDLRFIEEIGYQFDDIARMLRQRHPFNRAFGMKATDQLRAMPSTF